jgi:hypothetical protein
MLRGTTVLVGTFTLICAQLGAQVPAAPRPRVSPTAAAAGRAAKPRIAGIAPAPVQYQAPPIPTTGLFTNITQAPSEFGNTIPFSGQQTFAQPGFGQPSFGQPSFGQPAVSPRPAAFFFVPALVLSDGRIFANFNGTYEEVLRQCPVFAGTVNVESVGAACWIVDTAGRYKVIQRR